MDSEECMRRCELVQSLIQRNNEEIASHHALPGADAAEQFPAHPLLAAAQQRIERQEAEVQALYAQLCSQRDLLTDGPPVRFTFAHCQGHIDCPPCLQNPEPWLPHYGVHALSFATQYATKAARCGTRHACESSQLCCRALQSTHAAEKRSQQHAAHGSDCASFLPSFSLARGKHQRRRPGVRCYRRAPQTVAMP